MKKRSHLLLEIALLTRILIGALKFAIQFPEQVNQLVLIFNLDLGREIDLFKKLLSVVPAIANIANLPAWVPWLIIGLCLMLLVSQLVT